MAISTATHASNQVSSPGGHVEATPVLDTVAYTSGDLLFDATEVPVAVTWAGGYSILESVEVLDEDAAGTAFDLLILNAADSLGTVNNAFAASDTLCRGIVAIVSIGSSDFIALGSGSKRASIGGIGKLVQAAAGQTSLWIAAIDRGGPTHAATGLRIRLGFLCG